MMDDAGHVTSHAEQVVIGVDTHKDQHVAVAIDGRSCRAKEALSTLGLVA